MAINTEILAKRKLIYSKNMYLLRFWPNSTMAISARAAQRFGERRLHHLGRNQRRVQADRPGWGGATLGRAQVEAKHELRQTEPRVKVRNTYLHRSWTFIGREMNDTYVCRSGPESPSHRKLPICTNNAPNWPYRFLTTASHRSCARPNKQRISNAHKYITNHLVIVWLKTSICSHFPRICRSLTGMWSEGKLHREHNTIFPHMNPGNDANNELLIDSIRGCAFVLCVHMVEEIHYISILIFIKYNMYSIWICDAFTQEHSNGCNLDALATYPGAEHQSRVESVGERNSTVKWTNACVPVSVRSAYLHTLHTYASLSYVWRICRAQFMQYNWIFATFTCPTLQKTVRFTTCHRAQQININGFRSELFCRKPCQAHMMPNTNGKQINSRNIP